MTPHRLALVHPFDPRRIAEDLREPRLAAILASRPADFRLLVVGIDRVGDLELGRVVSLEVAGRAVDFVPVARAGRAAFAFGLLRHLAAVRAAARAEVSSSSCHGFPWVPLARLVGRPVVLMVHEDPRAEAVAGRIPVLRGFAEATALRLADRIVACDPTYLAHCREICPSIAAKGELLALSSPTDGRAASLFDQQSRMARLWERHRRLFDAHALHRGGHHAAA